MYKFLSVLLIAFAISTPAHADIFGFFASNGGSEQVMDGQAYPGQAYAPAPNNFADGSMHGYPFYSGCCDSYSPCYDDLWAGYCGSKGCGTKGHHGRHCGSMKGGCGIGCGAACGPSYCGKGGCGFAAPHAFGGKSNFGGYLNYRGLGGKGGCGIGSPCGGKGCDTCAPAHGRLGLFDWMHFGHGHGCDVCGGAGCSECGGGKGGFGKGDYMNYAPAPGFGDSYYGTPTNAQEESTLQPPQVLVEPTSISDRSAWRVPVPTNPFARLFNY